MRCSKDMYHRRANQPTTCNHEPAPKRTALQNESKLLSTKKNTHNTHIHSSKRRDGIAAVLWAASCEEQLRGVTWSNRYRRIAFLALYTHTYTQTHPNRHHVVEGCRLVNATLELCVYYNIRNYGLLNEPGHTKSTTIH